MATDLEKLVVQLSADIKGYQRAMERASGVTNKQARAIENRFNRMNRHLDNVGRRAAQSLIAPLTGVAAVLGAREIGALADTWTDLSSRVNIAAGGVDEGADVLGRLGDISRRTYSSLESTAEGYILNARVMQEYGYTTSQTLDFLESLNNALVVSGARGDRARQVMDAISKAMALGSLQGDNLNTVIEVGGRVAEALAESMGVGVAELRRLGQQGKITTRELFGITNQMEVLRRQADSMPATISDGIQLIRNAMLQYVGNADQARGLSATLAQGLIAVADNFEQAADAGLKLAAVLAAALLGRSIAGMIAKLGLGAAALARFTQALVAVRTMAGLSTAISGIGAAAGPVGLLVGGALVGSLVLFTSSSNEATAASERWAKALEKAKKAGEGASETIEVVATSNAKAAKEIEGAILEGERVVEHLSASLQRLPGLLDHFTMRDIVSPEQVVQIRELVQQFNRGEVSVGDLQRAVDQLAKGNPRLGDILKPLLEQLEQAKVATGDLLGELGKVSAAEAAGVDRAAQKIQEKAQAYIDEAMTRNRLSSEQLQIETEIARVREHSAKQGVTLTEQQVAGLARANVEANKRRQEELKNARSSERGGKRFQEELQSARDRATALIQETDLLRQLNPLVEDYGRTLEKARMERALMNAATKAEVEVTPELAAEIGKIAEAYGNASAASRQLAETQNEMRQRFDQMKDLGKDVLSGFASDLREGKSAADALSGALERIADRLIDMALNSAIDGLFDNFKSIGGKGGGGLFGALGKLIGFSEGGFTGAGGKHQPKGVVHGGEYVFSKRATEKAGVANLEALHNRLKGYANGGYVAPSAPALSAPTMPSLSRLAPSAGSSITYAPTIDARGADQAAVARIEQVMARDRMEFEARVIRAVKGGHTSRKL